MVAKEEYNRRFNKLLEEYKFDFKISNTGGIYIPEDKYDQNIDQLIEMLSKAGVKLETDDKYTGLPYQLNSGIDKKIAKLYNTLDGNNWVEAIFSGFDRKDNWLDAFSETPVMIGGQNTGHSYADLFKELIIDRTRIASQKNVFLESFKKTGSINVESILNGYTGRYTTYHTITKDSWVDSIYTAEENSSSLFYASNNIGKSPVVLAIEEYYKNDPTKRHEALDLLQNIQDNRNNRDFTQSFLKESSNLESKLEACHDNNPQAIANNTTNNSQKTNTSHTASQKAKPSKPKWQKDPKVEELQRKMNEIIAENPELSLAALETDGKLGEKTYAAIKKLGLDSELGLENGESLSNADFRKLANEGKISTLMATKSESLLAAINNKEAALALKDVAMNYDPEFKGTKSSAPRNVPISKEKVELGAG